MRQMLAQSESGQHPGDVGRRRRSGGDVVAVRLETALVGHVAHEDERAVGSCVRVLARLGDGRRIVGHLDDDAVLLDGDAVGRPEAGSWQKKKRHQRRCVAREFRETKMKLS